MRMTRWLLGIASLLLAIGVHAAVVDIEAGPISNNMDAGHKCPGICSERGAIKWTGDWRTTVMGQMSVCSCQFAEPKPVRPTPAAPLAGSNVEIEAGPIWANEDADNKCPQVCGSRGGQWTGQWRTTQPGRMSVCSCQGVAPPQPLIRPFLPPSPAVTTPNSCSIGGTAKCPGCSVSCPPGERPICSPPRESVNLPCTDAWCRCLGT
jgi:hypothetical protein